jgi:hypothetical protein
VTRVPRPPAGLAWAMAAGLGLGLLALGPGLRRGFLLSYDMVFVPAPPFNDAMFGLAGTLPRSVPSDAVVAVAARVLPADIVQKLVLLAIFVLAAAGVAVLLSGEHPAARVAAGVFYAWNPFVAERLIIGQWALLLGYAGLPWAAVALAGRGRARGQDGPDSPPGTWRRAGLLLVALLPAAVGGFAAMCVSGLLVVPAAAWAAGAAGWRRLSSVLTALAVLGLLSLDWLIPSLAQPVHTSTAGVAAFAARADTPFGTLGSLLMLGGAWNAQTVPQGYGGPGSAAWLVVVLAALAAFAVLGARRWPGVAVAGLAGLAVSSIGITGPGQDLLRSMITAWPGFAVLRDGQQFVAPLALAEAAGFGLGVSWLLSRPALSFPRQRGASAPEAHGDHLPASSKPALLYLASTVALVLPLALLPGLAWGADGRLRPAAYPADWLAARRVIDADPAPGSVLLLPWAAYRRFGWNDGEAVLDPWPKLLARRVIWNDGVQVGNVAIPAEDPAAARLSRVIDSPAALTGPLRAAGVRYVIVDAGLGASGSPYSARLPGSRVVLAGPGLAVYRLPSGTRPTRPRGT